MYRFRMFFVISFMVFLCAPMNLQAATEIQMWHALAGPNGEKLNQICSQFN